MEPHPLVWWRYPRSYRWKFSRAVVVLAAALPLLVAACRRLPQVSLAFNAILSITVFAWPIIFGHPNIGRRGWKAFSVSLAIGYAAMFLIPSALIFVAALVYVVVW